MSIPIFQLAISMAAYLALLLFIVDFMRKNYKFANFFWIGTLLTFPLWLMGGVQGWFRWSKILSVILPTIFLGFCRIAAYEKRKGKVWENIQKNWVLWFFYGILFLNIMEATVKDLTLGNYFNAATGFLLCATIPFAPKFWRFEKEQAGDLIVYTTIGWNLLYTTWNACFVYAESPKYFAASLCIILAAEIYPLLKGRPELYVISRVYTLATHVIIRASIPWLFPLLMDASSWQNPTTLKYWGIINFCLIVPYLFWYLWKLHTGKADGSFIRKNKTISY